MPVKASLSALRLKRRELEEGIEELESGSARVEKLGPEGFRGARPESWASCTRSSEGSGRRSAAR